MERGNVKTFAIISESSSSRPPCPQNDLFSSMCVLYKSFSTLSLTCQLPNHHSLMSPEDVLVRVRVQSTGKSAFTLKKQTNKIYNTD